MHTKLYRLVASIVLALGGLVGSAALGLDPPDSAVNPQSGSIEVVDELVGASKADVRHTINQGKDRDKEVFDVTTDPLDDLSPRLAISAAGDTWVVWWRDEPEADRVLVRKRTYATKTWSEERAVSMVGESSRDPDIVHDGVGAWVVFELDDPEGGTSIGVTSIVDEPDPIPTRSIVATTQNDGVVDVGLHHDTGELWVTWVDGPIYVGWSEYDYSSSSWSAPAYELYEAGDVAGARSKIRVAVLTD